MRSHTHSRAQALTENVLIIATTRPNQPPPASAQPHHAHGKAALYHKVGCCSVLRACMRARVCVCACMILGSKLGVGARYQSWCHAVVHPVRARPRAVATYQGARLPPHARTIMHSPAAAAPAMYRHLLKVPTTKLGYPYHYTYLNLTLTLQVAVMYRHLLKVPTTSRVLLEPFTFKQTEALMKVRWRGGGRLRG